MQAEDSLLVTMKWKESAVSESDLDLAEDWHRTWQKKTAVI